MKKNEIIASGLKATASALRRESLEERDQRLEAQQHRATCSRDHESEYERRQRLQAQQQRTARLRDAETEEQHGSLSPTHTIHSGGSSIRFQRAAAADTTSLLNHCQRSARPIYPLLRSKPNLSMFLARPAYVALFRVGSPNNLFVFALEGHTRNAVYRGVNTPENLTPLLLKGHRYQSFITTEIYLERVQRILRLP